MLPEVPVSAATIVPGHESPATSWALVLAVLRDLEGGRKSQARFLLNSLRYAAILQRCAASAGTASSLGAYVRQRPEICGALVWPYQCLSWPVAERFARIESHFSVLDTAPSRFRFGVSQTLLLADLSGWSPGARLVLNQPKWLFREGLLALNIFIGEDRAYSLSFSLRREGSQTQIFVGGLQGLRSVQALAHYRRLTEDFHGLRPRDLLVDMLNACAPLFGVTRILAVSDEYQISRHAYFGGYPHAGMLSHYNEIWLERGGRRVAATHFELPLAPSIRPLQDVPSRKRARYRRRNEMLLSLVERVRDGADSGLVEFDRARAGQALRLDPGPNPACRAVAGP